MLLNRLQKRFIPSKTLDISRNIERNEIFALKLMCIRHYITRKIEYRGEKISEE